MAALDRNISGKSVCLTQLNYCYFHYDDDDDDNETRKEVMSPPLPRPPCTRLSSQAHSYTVQTFYAKLNQYLFSFFPFTGKLWSNLPASVFRTAYD